MENTNVLLVDLTAVFLNWRVRWHDRPLDYRRLELKLRESAKLPQFDVAIGFTTYDIANKGQARFLDTITKHCTRDNPPTLGWAVETIAPFDAAVRSPAPESVADPSSQPAEPRYVLRRFDAEISFSLGLVCKPNNNVVVVSDSYGLFRPLADASRRGAKTFLAFWQEQWDRRYNKYQRQTSRPFEFIDLDEFASELVGADSKQVGFGQGLQRLP